MESPPTAGDRPVAIYPLGRPAKSRTGHVKSCPKTGGPPSKAKYERMTDSAQYREGKVKSTPRGE